MKTTIHKHVRQPALFGLLFALIASGHAGIAQAANTQDNEDIQSTIIRFKSAVEVNPKNSDLIVF